MNLKTLTMKYIGVFALFMMTACVGPRNPMSIGNANPRYVVRDVSVSADQSRLATFKEIAPNDLVKAKPISRDVPTSLTVAWVDSDGTRHSEELALSSLIHQQFQGQIVVEITPENTLSLKLIGPDPKEESSLPLSPPEDWEGSIMVPGME